MKIKHDVICYKCGTPVGADAQIVNPAIVEMAHERFGERDDVVLQQQYLCKDGEGCQAPYQHTWGAYLTTSVYDMVLAAAGLVVIFGQSYILHDVFYNIGADIPHIVDMVFAIGFVIIGAALSMGYPPFFISTLVFIGTAWSLWAAG